MSINKNLKKLTKNEVLAKIFKFCTYQERSSYEVRQKLNDYPMNLNEKEEIMDEIQEENFINDRRFSEIYTSGKFRIKKWGKLKIKNGLLAKGIHKELIEESLNTIDDETYRETLNGLYRKKYAELTNETPMAKKQKLFFYLQSKGFEAYLIHDLLKEIKD
jgi:regulatory protein